jgi:hypothetical protein
MIRKHILLSFLSFTILLLSSCVSSGLMDFSTAETLPPLHLGIGVDLDGSSVTVLPDLSLALRLGLFPGSEIGIRAGSATLLANLKYKFPFSWDKAALAIAISGGANFDHRVAQIQLPIYFDYRFNPSLAWTVSQISSIYLGNYPGFSIIATTGLKWNIRKFFIFPQLGGGFISPKGDWSFIVGSSSLLGTYSTTFAVQQFLLSYGLSIGFDF